MQGRLQGSAYPEQLSSDTRWDLQKQSVNCSNTAVSWGSDGHKDGSGVVCQDISAAARSHAAPLRWSGGAADRSVRRTRRGGARPRVVFAAGGITYEYACARSAHAEARDARREWIERTGEVTAQTAMWTSRDGWLTEVAAWLAIDDGLAECGRRHIKPERVLRAAVVLAAHADHATGRNCAVANATVGRGSGNSARTVTTARQVLAAAGLAVEVHRGTGSVATPGCRRRPSIWHLISRPEPVVKAAAGVAVCALPPSRRDRRIGSVREISPSAREHARGPKSNSPNRSPKRGRRFAPRPLPLQLLAADLVAHVRSLGHAHIGHICDALAASGLELSAWDGKSLREALDADGKARGWDWPSRVERPGSLLLARLRRLPVRPAVASRGGVAIARAARTPSVLAQSVADSQKSAQARAQWCADVTAVTTEAQRARVLRAHQAKFGSVIDPVRAIAEAGRRASRLYPLLPLAEALDQWVTDVIGAEADAAVGERLAAGTSLREDMLINLATGKCDCVVCGAADAPLRPQLPCREMSMVCDLCWPVIAAELGVASGERMSA